MCTRESGPVACPPVYTVYYSFIHIPEEMVKTSSSSHGSGPGRKAAARPGRPRRQGARRRKQLVVDVGLLEQAMAVTGRNQSDTVNEALSQLTENAAILEGFERIRGTFPDHPDHSNAA